MRRLSGILLACTFLLLPAFTHGAAAQQAAPQKTTMEGDLALWSVAIRPDKTADYEQVVGKIKEALSKSQAPEAKQQLAGWKVLKTTVKMPDGNIIYTHVITPVPGADYSVLPILYATFTDPAEQKALYDLYRGSLAGNLGTTSGTFVADFSK